MSNAAKWSKNVVLIDADYADSVAFNLSVNFERMLGRQIPKADLADWLDCLALDGGLRPAPQNEVQCVFLYSPEKSTLRNFQPASLTSDLDGRAFRDNLGEFLLQSVPIEDVVGRKDFFCSPSKPSDRPPKWSACSSWATWSPSAATSSPPPPPSRAKTSPSSRWSPSTCAAATPNCSDFRSPTHSAWKGRNSFKPITEKFI